MASVSCAVKGTLMIACNCDYGCPCNVNGLPTSGHCEGGWTWHVASGNFDAEVLDGLNFSIFADWPGAIHEGGGKAVSYLDAQASDTQRAALTSIVLGEVGGPWEIFLTTYELEGPYPASYAVELDGERPSYVVGDAAELEIEPIRNPVTGAEIHPRLVLPEGLLTKEIGLFRSRRFRVRRGVEYDHSGRYAAVGSFSHRT